MQKNHYGSSSILKCYLLISKLNKGRIERKKAYNLSVDLCKKDQNHKYVIITHFSCPHPIQRSNSLTAKDNRIPTHTPNRTFCSSRIGLFFSFFSAAAVVHATFLFFCWTRSSWNCSKHQRSCPRSCSLYQRVRVSLFLHTLQSAFLHALYCDNDDDDDKGIVILIMMVCV